MDYQTSPSSSTSSVSSTEANTNSQRRVSDRTSQKDFTVMYGAGYALATMLLMWLDFRGLPDTDGNAVAHYFGSFFLLVACLIMLVNFLLSLGKTMLPDDPGKGGLRAFIGASAGVYVAVVLAVVSHWLDEKMFFYQLFWIKSLALPAACITVRYLGEKLNDKEGWTMWISSYGLVNLFLWLDLQNMPIMKDPGQQSFFEGLWVIDYLILVFLDAAILVTIIDRIVDLRIARDSSGHGKVLTILGTFIGVGIMVLGVMLPLELVFHILDGQHWMYQILLAEMGALPGAYFIGGSAWLAKTYTGQQSILPQYSTVHTIGQT